MEIKVFDSNMFEALSRRAENSARRRSNENIHHGYDARVQKLFITLMPDSYVRPHKHHESNKWEFFLMVKGEVSFLLFDEQGTCTKRMELCAGGNITGCEIPPGVWHCVVPKAQPATFFEVKEGPYIEIEDKGFAAWSPPEGQEQVSEFLAHLKNLKVGENAGAYQ